MGFRFPYSVASAWSPLPRACLTRYVPLPGFLNLLAAYSSLHLAGLFHPADTPGIFTLQSFLLATSRAPLRSLLCPLGITFPTNRWPRNLDSLGAADFDLGFVVDGPVGCLQGFPPVRELVVNRTVLPVAVTRCSPGLFPSLGSSPSRRWPGLHRASSHVLVGSTSQVALVRPSRPRFRVSLHRDGGFSLSRAPYPSEVSRLLLSHRFGKGRSGVMVSPRVRAYVASRADSLFGPFPFPCRSPM